jgi:hypothetical protein
LRRVARAAIAGQVILGTRDQQAELLRQLSRLLGRDSIVGRWLKELWLRW